MFQISAASSIAQQHSRSLFVDGLADNVLSYVFTASGLNYSVGVAPPGTREISSPEREPRSDMYASLPPVDVVVCCYMESRHYFAGREQQVRRMFTFREAVLRQARESLETLPPDVTRVGVHVRRLGIKQVAPLAYVERAMDWFRFRYARVHFVVCSDDPGWCKRQLGQRDVSVSEGQEPEVDLAVLSLMQHSIVTTGTYGWWGAWLAKGKVVYWKKAQQWDFYPPEWVGL